MNRRVSLCSGLVDSWFSQVVSGIAAARGLEPEAVKKLVDEGPFLAPEALTANLVDKLGYWSEFMTAARATANSDETTASVVRIERYLAGVERPNSNGPKVALIFGVGAVVPGADNNPFSGGATFAADTVAKALESATKDHDVQAILFRVDSPGGAYTAADTVWREVERASAAGNQLSFRWQGKLHQAVILWPCQQTASSRNREPLPDP